MTHNASCSKFLSLPQSFFFFFFPFQQLARRACSRSPVQWHGPSWTYWNHVSGTVMTRVRFIVSVTSQQSDKRQAAAPPSAAPTLNIPCSIKHPQKVWISRNASAEYDTGLLERDVRFAFNASDLLNGLRTE